MFARGFGTDGTEGLYARGFGVAAAASGTPTSAPSSWRGRSLWGAWCVALILLAGCGARHYSPEDVQICTDSSLTHPDYVCWE